MRCGGNNFNYFPKINWPNWQIACSLYICLCFVWRIGRGWASAPHLGYATDNKNVINSWRKNTTRFLLHI